MSKVNRANSTNRTAIRLALCALALGGVSLNGLAGTLTRTNINGFEVRGSGNQWTFGDATSRAGDLGWKAPVGSGSPIPLAGGMELYTDATSGPSVRSKGDLTIPDSGNRKLPVTVVAKVGKAAAATAIAKFAMTGLPIVGTAFAAYQMVVDLGFFNEAASGSPPLWKKADPQYCTTAPCYSYRLSVGGSVATWQTTRAAACTQAIVGANALNGPNWTYVNTGVNESLGGPYGACTYTYDFNQDSSPPGTSYTAFERQARTPDASAPKLLATEQDLADKIASESGWPTRSSQALAEAINSGQTVPHDPPVVSGPATVAGPQQTTVQPVTKPGPNGTTLTGNKTTNTTTTYGSTYNNNVTTITATTINNYTTIWSDGSTTTESGSDAQQPQAPEKEEAKDPCEDNPDRVGCTDKGEPPTDAIPKRTETITFTEENLFGEGSCPANVTAHLASLGQTVTVWDWASLCQKAYPLRALVLALATFAGFLIIMPNGKVSP